MRLNSAQYLDSDLESFRNPGMWGDIHGQLLKLHMSDKENASKAKHDILARRFLVLEIRDKKYFLQQDIC